MMRLEQPRAPLEQPERALTRLPRHPGPGARAVRCAKCDKTLGVADGGHIFVRHNGREATYSLPCEVRCERCGHRTLLLDSNPACA